MIGQKQTESLIVRYGDPNSPPWNRPETSVQIGYRKGTISKQEYEEDQKRRQENDARESEQRYVTLILYLASKIIGNSTYVTPEDTAEMVERRVRFEALGN